MSRNSQHIETGKFRKYLGDRMTGTERNLFERELQKSPFEEEAVEGLTTVPVPEFQNALAELQQKIGVGKRNTDIYLYRRIAAIAVLLLVAGISWFTVIRPLPEKQLADKEKVIEKPTRKEEISKTVNEPLYERITTEEKSGNIQGIAATVPAKPELLADTHSRAAQKDLKIVPSELVIEETKIVAEGNYGREKLNPEPEISDKEEPELAALEKRKAAVDKGIKATREYGQKTESGQIRIRGYSPAQNNTEKQRSVTGRVGSLPDNSPLPGVTVVEKGTGNGTITDAEGRFILKTGADSNSTLVMSFIGMKPKEVKIPGDSLNVVLEPDEVALNEVVVIGYGAQKKVTATGAVTGIRAMGRSFSEYSGEMARLSPEYPGSRETVKIGFTIQPDGRLTDFSNKNNAVPEIFERGVGIIRDWAQWKPRLKEGIPVETKETVRIEFRK